MCDCRCGEFTMFGFHVRKTGSWFMHEDGSFASWFWLAGLCDQLHVNHEGYTVTGRLDGGNSLDSPKGSFPWRFIKVCFSFARLTFPGVVQPALALSPGSDRQANWWTPTHSLQSNLARRTNQPHWSHSTRVSPSRSRLPHLLFLIIFSYLSLTLKGIVRQKIKWCFFSVILELDSLSPYSHIENNANILSQICFVSK